MENKIFFLLICIICLSPYTNVILKIWAYKPGYQHPVTYIVHYKIVISGDLTDTMLCLFICVKTISFHSISSSPSLQYIINYTAACTTTSSKNCIASYKRDCFCHKFIHDGHSDRQNEKNIPRHVLVGVNYMKEAQPSKLYAA